MRIIIAGDTAPTGVDQELFRNAKPEELIGKDLLDIWLSSDYRLLNLETPLYDGNSPIVKCGVTLNSPVDAIEGIRALRPSAVALANNHILDQGIAGLESTMRILKESGIPFLGAGADVIGAARPYIIDNGKKRIGVFACAEHEFSTASADSGGANPFDPMESLDQVRALKNECDHVIVLYHGGKEHYRYPAPYLRKVCRKIAEHGADIVICQHSHCIGCRENYSGSEILYGQGNFIFNVSDSDFAKTGLLVSIEVGESLDIRYIPLVRSGTRISLPDEETGGRIISEFNARSEEIKSAGFVARKYDEFAAENLDEYFRRVSGVFSLILRIDRKISGGKLLKAIYGKKRKAALLNAIECEAHRELFITGLKNIR